MLRLLHSFVFIVFCFPISMIAQDIAVASGPTGCDDVVETSVLCSLEELDGFVGAMENTTPDNPPCPLVTDCGGNSSCDNNIWFSFIATGTSLNITVDPFNCGAGSSPGSPFGMQGQVYQITDCSTLAGFTGVSNCFSQGGTDPDPNPFTLNCTGLVPGGLYTVMLDGFGGSTCEFEIALDDTDPPPTPSISNIDGPTDVCPGAEVTYCIDYVPAFPYVENYDFTASGVTSLSGAGIPYFNSFPPTQVCVDVDVNSLGVGTITATGENVCSEANVSSLTVVSANIDNPTEYDTLCIGSGNPVYWREHPPIFTPGTYSIDYTSYLGCDSTFTVEVFGCGPFINPPTVEHVCSEDLPFNFCNQDYTASGTYNCTTINYECGGCEEINTLILYVYDNEALVTDPDTLACGPAAEITLFGDVSIVSDVYQTNTYTWVASSGGNISSGSNQANIQVDEPGTYTLTVTSTSIIDPSFSCESSYTVEVVEDAAYPDPVGLDGLVEQCGPGNLDYTIIPAGTGVNPDGYVWTVTGGTLTDNGASATVDWTTSGTICVGAYNICDTSALTCLDVTILEFPVVSDIVGNNIACETDDTGIYSVDDNGWTYTWTVSNGVTGVTDVTTSELTVDFTTVSDPDAPIEICVVGTSDCGDSPAYCETVVLTLVPEQPTISGDDIVCVGESATYSINNNPLVTGVITTITNGLGTITNGANTNEITVDWTTAGNDEVCFEVSNNCGAAAPICFGVEIVELPTASLTDMDINFCPSGSDTAVVDVTLTGQGPWTVEVSDGILPPEVYNFSSTPSLITLIGEGSYSITAVSDMNGCVGTSSGVVNLIPYTSPVATLSGAGGICEGSGDCVMLEVLLDQAPGWTITYAIDGTAQAPITGIMTSPYMLQICQPGEIELLSVEDGNGCEGAASGIVNVENREIVTVADITPICDADGANYQIEFTITSGTAPFTVNSSLGITGTLTGNVFLSDPIPSESNYSFEVSDINNCNVVAVDGIHVCNCVNEVGTMDQNLIEVCDPALAIATYDPTLEFLPAGDIVEYVLHEGSGLSLVSPIAFNTVPEFSFDSGVMVYGQTYYISAICGEDDGTGTGSVDLGDLCIKVAQGTPVVFYEVPDFTVSLNDTICLSESHNIEVTFTAGQSPWSLVYSDDVSGVIDTLNGVLDNPYTLTVSPTQLTNYTFTEVYNSYNTAVCSQAKNETVQVEVFEAPSFANVQTTCNNTADGYTVSFEIVGGNPTTYEVISTITGTISGTMFTSDIIPDGNPYSFELTNGFCDTILIEDPNPIDCPCLSDVGVLVEASASNCGNGSIDLEYQAAGSEFLDGNDVLGYFLYSDPADIIGSVIQTNSSAPSFSLVAPMTYGTTYYIAAAVGNDDAGLPDLNDPCLDITVGVSVVWYEIPTVTISGSTDICIGESTDLILDFTGPAPYTVEIFDGANVETITDINTAQYIHTVSPTADTTYTVTAGSNDNCDLVISGSVDIVVNTAPVVTDVVETINANNTFVTVTIDIAGGSLPYVVTDALGNSDTINTTQFISAEIPCGDGYYFEVDDLNGCGPFIVEAASTSCPCITNVGSVVPDQTQVCNDTASFTYDNTDEVLDGNDVVQFILHNGDGVPLQYASAMNTFTFDDVTLNYGQTYIISVIAGDADINGDVDFNDQCFSTSGVGEVTFYEVPNAVLSGGGDLCLGNSMDINVELTSGVGPWTVTLLNELDGTESNHELSNSSDVITLSPTVTTTYSLTGLVDSEGVCTGTVSGTATIQVNDTPVVTNENVLEDFDSEELVVEFEINGGDQATYSVVDDNGVSLGTITNNQFVSFPFACEDLAGGIDQIFYVSDQYNCAVVEVPVYLECGCLTSIGDFSTSSVDYCFGDLIAFEALNIIGSDANDVLNYILTDDISDLSTYIAVSQTPEFVFDPNTMDCGVDYYVVGVLGDDQGGGIVDLNDQCLSVSSTLTVQVYCEIDFGFVEETITICSGETAFVNTFANVNGLFDLTINDPVTGDYEILGVENGDVISFQPSATGTYTLTYAIELETGLMCAVDLNDAVEIVVVEQGYSGIANNEPAFCEGTVTNVNLADLLDGEDSDGLWTAAGNYTGFNPLLGTFEVQGQTAGTYDFTYTVLGQANCDDVSTDVSVVVNPNPTADAGADQTITCNELILDIGGNQTSQGGVFTYTWLLGQTQLSNQDSSVATINEAGTYTLIVENTTTGCTDEDEILVDNIVETLVPSIVLEDPNCFGANDGSIQFSETEGGQAPYLYSIDGGESFQSLNIFDTLVAANYNIVVMDVNGCESQPFNVNIEDPNQLYVELDLFVYDEDNPNQMEQIEDGVVGYNDSILIQANILNEGLNTNISWYPEDFVDCEDCDEISFVATNTMYIEVTVGSPGCQERDNLSIFVEKEQQVFVPSLFTPNGDVANDFLEISVGSFVQNIKTFEIFDRWGAKVYDLYNFLPSETGSMYWDGTLNGQNCQSGVYIYHMEVEMIDGSIEIISGDIALTR